MLGAYDACLPVLMLRASRPEEDISCEFHKTVGTVLALPSFIPSIQFP